MNELQPLDINQSPIPHSQGFSGRLSDMGYEPPADMKIEQFSHEVGLTMHMQRWINWALGDLLVYGEERWPERYKDAVLLTGKSEQHLYNVAWVARVFPIDRRRGDLTWSHHLEVAGLPREEQDMWLDKASENHWSRAKLRSAREGGKATHGDEDTPPGIEIPEGFTTPMREGIMKFIAACEIQRPEKEKTVEYVADWGIVRVTVSPSAQSISSSQEHLPQETSSEPQSPSQSLSIPHADPPAMNQSYGSHE